MTESQTLVQPQEADQAKVRTFTYAVVHNEMALRPEGRKLFHNIKVKFIGVPDRMLRGAMMLFRALEELELQHWEVYEEGGFTIHPEKKKDLRVLFSGVVENDFIPWTYDESFDRWLIDYLSEPKA